MRGRARARESLSRMGLDKNTYAEVASDVVHVGSVRTFLEAPRSSELAQGGTVSVLCCGVSVWLLLEATLTLLKAQRLLKAPSPKPL